MKKRRREREQSRSSPSHIQSDRGIESGGTRGIRGKREKRREDEGQTREQNFRTSTFDGGAVVAGSE